jgi:hypothetical protein
MKLVMNKLTQITTPNARGYVLICLTIAMR